MSILVRLLFRPGLYVAMIAVAVIFMDPVKLRSSELFLGTIGYMGMIWFVFSFRKCRLYECKPKNAAITYGLLLLAPPALYISGAYGTAFMSAYLMVLAGLVFPIPGIDVFKHISADAEEFNKRRQR